MWFPRSKTKLENKKGISSIVGGIFFLVLMTSGFTVYYIALDTQSQMLDVQQIIADTEVAKIKEKFVVAASSSGVNNLLSLQVVNTGNNAVEIADVWIINKTGTENATRYDLDYRDVSIPVGHSGNILSNTPLYLISDIYDIKVISSIGTIQAVEYDVAGGSNVLRAQMVAIPQDVRFGENATVILMVTNTGDFDIVDVTANSLDVIPNQCTVDPNPIFVGPTNLSPSQSTMFFWDCVLDPPSANIMFIGNATGQLSGVPVDSNDASDSVTVGDYTGGTGEEIVLKEDLFGKPGIFMVLPSPFGWTPTGVKGLWGMNIVNPTGQNMWVNKAVLSLTITRAEEDDKIFKSGSCSPTGITPPIDVWACTTHNQLKWEPSVGGQHLIPPKSVQQFLAVADEGNLNANTGVLDTILVTGSVFTTLGQFAKTGYGTALQQNGPSNNFPLVNVYLTRNENFPLTVSDIHTTELGMISGTAKTFYAVLADFDPDNTKFIKNNISRLIINIPPNWTLNSSESDHFTITTSTNPDNSIQLIGTLDTIIDGEGGAGRLKAGIIQFNVTPPAVSDKKMYVMHILADGYTDADFLIGPIAEVVLQVCPTGGCS